MSNRLKRHWDEWFTFLTYPEVKPDNNDAERALRPVVIHRQVSGGARSDWGAQLLAQMFSFLETMRLQGDDAIAQLCELLSVAGRSPPGLHSTQISRACYLFGYQQAMFALDHPPHSLIGKDLAPFSI